MNNRIHTSLCWLLAISLSWLPLSVSASTSMSAMDTDDCHEMNSAMQRQTVSAISIDVFAASEKCCNHFTDGCMSNEAAACSQGVNYSSLFVVLEQYLNLHALNFFTMIEQAALYHSQTTSPENPPPVL